MAKFTVGPEYKYWPVYDGTRVVALCPNMSEAQALVDVLNKPKKKRKRLPKVARAKKSKANGHPADCRCYPECDPSW